MVSDPASLRVDWQVAPEAILVAVPTLNEESAIEACLRSLMTGNAALRRVPVVVADGGSTDATRAIVTRLMDEFPNLRLIDNPARLQSAAINLIAQTQAGPQTQVLVRTDAHAIYPSNYILRVADSLARQQADAVVISMDSVGSECFQQAAAWAVDTRIGSGGSAHRGGRQSRWIDHGHHAAMRLDRFLQVGGYDPSFSHNEDAELDHRIGLSGGRLWLDADIRLDYQMRRTPGKLARQYWNYGRGRARTILKHRMRPRLRQMIPAVNVVLLVACVLLAALSRWWLVWPAFYLTVLAAVSVQTAVKHRSVCGLLAGVAIFIMHNFWGAGMIHGLLTQRGRT